MLESLPILSDLYVRPERTYSEFGDFPDLPEGVHDRIRSFIRTEVPCSGCTNFLCSCSGGARSEVVFLPGERKWAEFRLPGKFRGTHPNKFPVSGDCLQLTGTKCGAGYYKPFDCISFPLQPVVVEGHLVPTFAKNCSFHPADLDPRWISDRWKAWQYIFSLIPEWVEIYGQVSPGELLHS